MQNIRIPIKFTLSDIVKASFIVVFLKPLMIAILSVALLGFIFFYPIFFVRFWALWLFIVMPLWVFYLAWRNFKTNPLMHEEQVVEINEKGVSVVGQSFNSQREWSSIHKVSSGKWFVFIWLTKRLAYPLPRHLFSDEMIIQLHSIVSAHPHISNGIVLPTAVS